MNMHNLFPIPIGMFDLDRDLTDEEMLFVRGQDTRANEGNTTSKNNFVLRDSVMTSLRGWVEDCVTEYFKATSNPKHDVQLRITIQLMIERSELLALAQLAQPSPECSLVFQLRS